MFSGVTQILMCHKLPFSYSFHYKADRIQLGRAYTFAVGESLTICSTVTISDQWLTNILSCTEKWEVYFKCGEIC